MIKIGRNATNDVILNDPTVSSQHAVLIIGDTGTVQIKDLNSTNGTYVNGKRIQAPSTLSDGDVVRLGNSGIDWKKMIDGPLKTKVTPSPGIILPQGVLQSYKVGRNPDMQVRMPYDDVSGFHAVLYKRSDGSVVVQDNHSTNGTYVNGNKVASQTLCPGDQVMVSGKYPLQWEQLLSVSATPPASKPRLTWVAVAIVMVLLLGGGGAYYWWTHREWSPEKVYATYRKSVVLIYKTWAYAATVQGKPLGSYVGDDNWNNFVIDEEGDVAPGTSASTGTGFFISSDGKIMTNKHVADIMGKERQQEEAKIKEAVQVALVRSFGEQALEVARALEVHYTLFSIGVALNDTHVNSEQDLLPCSIYRVSDNDKVDIAIIQTNSKQTPPEVKHIVNLDERAKKEELTVGSKVYTIGFPKSFTLGGTEAGLEANNQSGEITQERGDFEYGHNITIHQGASGSPIFNSRGKFAGVVVSGFLGLSQGYNQAVQPDKAAALAQ